MITAVNNDTKYQPYAASGVYLKPVMPSHLDTLIIKYNGVLVGSGADTIYAHIGFGQNWTHIAELKMQKNMSSFELSFDMPIPADCINLCFRDSADNWDNNSGRNYTYTIELDAHYGGINV
ncbi:hypothetical protein SRRS_41880 [Sporomusa rhizae]|uniref:carbohydrate-binding protein n=1 Tax=Sporomusa rhizae TaxID=357999 RepID=UPI00352A1C39